LITLRYHPIHFERVLEARLARLASRHQTEYRRAAFFQVFNLLFFSATTRPHRSLEMKCICLVCELVFAIRVAEMLSVGVRFDDIQISLEKYRASWLADMFFFCHCACVMLCLDIRPPLTLPRARSMFRGPSCGSRCSKRSPCDAV